MFERQLPAQRCCARGLAHSAKHTRCLPHLPGLKPGSLCSGFPGAGAQHDGWAARLREDASVVSSAFPSEPGLTREAVSQAVQDQCEGSQPGYPDENIVGIHVHIMFIRVNECLSTQQTFHNSDMHSTSHSTNQSKVQ